MENLAIYNQLRQVPKEAQKPFNNGRFSGTDINPMWRIKQMTELFGACGLGWYVEVKERQLQTAPDGKTVCAFVALNLYIKQGEEWSKPIYGEGGNTFTNLTSKGYLMVSDEAYKMAYTDAFSNATKQLGLGADIWFANDKQHGTKYDVQAEQAKQAQAAPTTKAAPKATPAQTQTEPTVIQQRRIVLDYLKDNQQALSYFLDIFKKEDIYTLSDAELISIYNRLKKNGKI